MTRIELHYSELLVETVICRRAIDMERAVATICSDAAEDEKERAKGQVIKSVCHMSKAFAIEKPESQDNRAWREWLEAWNRYMLKAGKTTYTIHADND